MPKSNGITSSADFASAIDAEIQRAAKAVADANTYHKNLIAARSAVIGAKPTAPPVDVAPTLPTIPRKLRVKTDKRGGKRIAGSSTTAILNRIQPGHSWSAGAVFRALSNSYPGITQGAVYMALQWLVKRGLLVREGVPRNYTYRRPIAPTAAPQPQPGVAPAAWDAPKDLTF